MQTLTPDEARQILCKDGLNVSEQQAASMLHFIQLIAEITISQLMKL